MRNEMESEKYVRWEVCCASARSINHEIAQLKTYVPESIVAISNQLLLCWMVEGMAKWQWRKNTSRVCLMCLFLSLLLLLTTSSSLSWVHGIQCRSSTVPLECLHFTSLLMFIENWFFFVWFQNLFSFTFFRNFYTNGNLTLKTILKQKTNTKNCTSDK